MYTFLPFLSTQNINPILMTSNQVQVSEFFCEFTQYENEDVQEIYTTLDDYRKVWQACSPDNDYPLSEVQNKLIIHPTFQIKT